MVLALLVSGPSPADKKGPEDLPEGAVFRYQDDEGNTRMSSTLPREAIQYGYEIVGHDGRVLETVEPPPTGEELEQRRREQERQRELERQRERDRQLRSQYGDAENARRVRDRQINAIQVNIDYARNSIRQAQSQLDAEITSAAEHERAGREVPEGVDAAIEHYNNQIDTLEKDIREHEAEIDKVREEFAPIIERLEELEEDSEGT